MASEALRLGQLTIEWESAGFYFPIGVHPTLPGHFVTLCEIRYRYGNYPHPLEIPKGFVFDGATIPWYLRWLPGFAKHDWHLLATLPHDYICQHPELLPRSVGDGIFVSVMLAIAETHATGAETKTEKTKLVLQAWAMYAGVVAYTITRAVSGVAIQSNGSKP